MNLYNFEDEEFNGSKYVLTSPRSLQACDILGVKVCRPTIPMRFASSEYVDYLYEHFVYLIL